VTAARQTPKGCCPGCLMSFEGEPCGLHRAAADLMAAAKEALAFFEVCDDAEANRVAALLRAAIDKAGGAR
jgi:hypothetical protein